MTSARRCGRPARRRSRLTLVGGPPPEDPEKAPSTPPDPGGPRTVDARPPATYDTPTASTVQRRTLVPLLGAIATSTPILAEAHAGETLSLPTDLGNRGALFSLRVRGNFMIEARVAHGVTVVRRQAVADNGIVAALIDDETTGETPFLTASV